MNYSKSELREMARTFMKNPNSARAKELCWELAFRTGMQPTQVLNKIAAMAR